MLNENAIVDFKANLRGRAIEPSDKDYDEARKVYNGMIHKKPRLIARCADVADVINSVNFARENDLLVAIRSGGHNAGGLGICDDGLVIDLSPIKYTRIDPVARTVTVGGGCTWGDVDHATHVFGMATPSGTALTIPARPTSFRKSRRLQTLSCRSIAARFVLDEGYLRMNWRFKKKAPRLKTKG
jgi:FAD/FMN-containing dehydrogenase